MGLSMSKIMQLVYDGVKTALRVDLVSGGYGALTSFGRPDNVDAYLANDVVGGTAAALTFPNVGPSGGGEVIIKEVALRIDVTGLPVGMSTFRLHLYNVTPPSALADNAPWDLPAGDRAAYLGYIDIPAMVDVGSTLYVMALAVDKQVTLLSSNLYGYLVTVAAYTPTAQSVHAVSLHTIRM